MSLSDVYRQRRAMRLYCQTKVGSQKQVRVVLLLTVYHADLTRRLLRMSGSMEEALHLLYKTTIAHGCFPGKLPLASAVEPTTEDILTALGFSTGTTDPRSSPSLTASSLPEQFSLPKDLTVNVDHHRPLPAQQKPKKPRVSFATSADAMDSYENTHTIPGDNLPTRPLGMQTQHQFSSYSSQATTLSGSASQSIQEPGEPVDMRTQFAIAVGDSLPEYQPPMLPIDPVNDMTNTCLTDSFLDLAQCSSEPLDIIAQPQAMQIDSTTAPPYFNHVPYT